MTNTVIFPPSRSASGQALDAALSVCGLLLAEDRLTPGLSNSISATGDASQSRREPAAVRTGAGGPDVAGPAIQLGPAGRNSSAASGTSKHCTGWPTWSAVRGDRLPVLFSAVELSGRRDGSGAVSDGLQPERVEGSGCESGFRRRRRERTVEAQSTGCSFPAAHGRFADYCLRLPELMLLA